MTNTPGNSRSQTPNGAARYPGFAWILVSFICGALSFGLYMALSTPKFDSPPTPAPKTDVKVDGLPLGAEVYLYRIDTTDLNGFRQVDEGHMPAEGTPGYAAHLEWRPKQFEGAFGSLLILLPHDGQIEIQISEH